MKNRDNVARIRKIYRERDEAGKRDLYAWFRPEVRLQEAEIDQALARLMRQGKLHDFSRINILDVGCGTGKLLRRMMEWGADPCKLLGTEFLPERLTEAREKTVAAVRWHLGPLEELDPVLTFDLVCAFTVFSSLTDDLGRQELANRLWERTKPGGAILLFDFRAPNLRNKDVRRVRRREIGRWWPKSKITYRSLLVVPPLSRFIASFSPLTVQLLGRALPFLRTHFICVVRKLR